VVNFTNPQLSSADPNPPEAQTDMHRCSQEKDHHTQNGYIWYAYNRDLKDTFHM